MSTFNNAKLNYYLMVLVEVKKLELKLQDESISEAKRVYIESEIDNYNRILNSLNIME